jgi:hypothetical protein
MNWNKMCNSCHSFCSFRRDGSGGDRMNRMNRIYPEKTGVLKVVQHAG